MKRREFVERFGIGSAGLISGVILANGTATPAQETPARENDDAEHAHRPVTGPLSAATVSFGVWKSDPPLDRYANPGTPPDNVHLVIPYVSTIKAGGSVNFIISGLHQIAVYGPGKEPDDIDTSLLRLTTGTIAGVPLINDPDRRIYAGLDPGAQPVDRIEAVHFASRGVHLVICAVLPHFEDKMWGFVRVI